MSCDDLLAFLLFGWVEQKKLFLLGFLVHFRVSLDHKWVRRLNEVDLAELKWRPVLNSNAEGNSERGSQRRLIPTLSHVFLQKGVALDKSLAEDLRQEKILSGMKLQKDFIEVSEQHIPADRANTLPFERVELICIQKAQNEFRGVVRLF